MAQLRCEDHPPDSEWAAAVEPVGYPGTAAQCSVRSHDHPTPALVYLSPEEYYFYRAEKRTFTTAGAGARIRTTSAVVREGHG